MKNVLNLVFTLTLSVILFTLSSAQNINFELVTPDVFKGADSSSIAFADVDGDQDQDVIIAGASDDGQTALYLNDGEGIFTEALGTSFTTCNRGDLEFSDMDSDNDQDLLIAGYQTILYTNNGSGSFTDVTGTYFHRVYESSIAIADINGNGSKDFVITGDSAGADLPITRFYFDGVLDIEKRLEGVWRSSVAFADIDNDNDPDLLITGLNISNQSIAELYKNIGNGYFEKVIGTPFVGVQSSCVSFADVDNDNDQDVLITGFTNTSQNVAKLFLNNGTGNFTEKFGTPFTGGHQSSIAFADVDHDNDLDVLITGTFTDQVANLYSNDSSGNFTLIADMPFQGVCSGSVAFANVNRDEYPDVLITGTNSLGVKTACLYKNTTCIPTSSTINVTACDIYIAPDGTEYTESGQYTATIENAKGCDSIITINLTINTSSYSTIDTLACNTYIAPDGTEYTESGQYTATIENAKGCDSIITINLTLNTSSYSTIDTLACNTYIAPDGTEYIESGQYTSTITNSKGCDSIITINLSFIDNSVTQDGSTLTANASGFSYQWIICNSNSPINGETNQSFTPMVSGYYAVIISYYSCEITSDCYYVTITDLINNVSIENNELYPNPAWDHFIIKYIGSQIENLKIINIIGQDVTKLVKVNIISNSSIMVDISDLHTGIYFVVTSSKNYIVYKL